MNENVLNKLKLPIILIFILLAISFLSVVPVLNMILLGAMLAYGIRPIASKIQTKTKYQSVSIIFAIVIVIIPIILVMVYMIFESIGLMSSFLNAGGFSLGTNSSEVGTIIVQNLPVNVQDMIQPHIGRINAGISQLFSLLLNYIFEFVKDVPNALIKIFILVCSIYYFTKDGDNIWDYVFAFIPDNQKTFFDNVFNDVGEVLKSIFYGHFLTAIIIGVMAAIGYYILGYPFILFIGVVTAFFQLLPVLGPWIVYWSLILYDVFITGNIPRAIITLLFGFVLSLSDMYIRPSLTSRYVDVHPLILLIGFLAGPLTLGLIGFILGPLILGITYAVIISVKKEIDLEKSKESGGVDSTESEPDSIDLEKSEENEGLTESEPGDIDLEKSGENDEGLTESELDDIDSVAND